MSQSRRDFLGHGLAVAPAAAVVVGGVAVAGGVVAVSPASAAPVAAVQPLVIKQATSQAQLKNGTVSASVCSGLLSKADRLFKGDVTGRITEIVQNARRAGAKNVKVTSVRCEGPKQQWSITVEDDGHGIVDFGQLLRLGFSGWDDELEAAEDPAGAGFFCLMPRDVRACSRGYEINVTSSGWLGMPIRVEASEYQGTGLLLQFVDNEEWSEKGVRDAMRFSGVDLCWNGINYPAETFLHGTEHLITHIPELGVKVQLVPSDQLASRKPFGVYYRTPNVVLNFHGQLVDCSNFASSLGVLNELNLAAMIDMTGEPTSLRLQLPDRRNLVQNEVSAALLKAIERLAYQSVSPDKKHHLRHSTYLSGLALGIPLAEAVQSFSHGVGDWHSECDNYVMGGNGNHGKPYLCSDVSGDSEGRTLDILSVHCDEFPYDMVEVVNGYAGYSWAAAKPTVNETELEYTDGRNFYVNSGSIRVVDRLQVRVTIMPTGYYDNDDEDVVELYDAPLAAESSEDVVITRDALNDGNFDELVWYMTGGYNEDEDRDAQFEDFSEQLEQARCDLLDDNEYARRQLTKAVDKFVGALVSSKALAHDTAVSVQVVVDGGKVTVRTENGTKFVCKATE